MAKFHINGKGIPAPCKAKSGNCPFGGSDSHYDTIVDAQKAADKNNEAEHSILPNNSSNLKITKENIQYNMKNIHKMRFNDVSVLFKSGEKIDGVLTGDSYVNKLKVRPYGDFNKENVVELNFNNIEYLEQLSNRDNDWSSNREYFESLRKNNKSRPEFRLSLQQMRDISLKFVKVNYDGKKFDGKVIDFYNDGVDNSGLIIENGKGEIKQIKNYRLTKLEITGNDEKAHENHLINDEIIYDIEEKYKEDEEYISVIPSDAFDNEFEVQYGPISKVDEYFDARIRAHAGEKIDLDKYENIDWYGAVSDNRDFYKEGSYSWNEYSGADLHESMTQASEEKMDEAYDMADDAYTYFGERQDLINDTFKEVQNVDWTPYHNSQLEGEIAALRRIYKEKIVSM